MGTKPVRGSGNYNLDLSMLYVVFKTLCQSMFQAKNKQTAFLQGERVKNCSVQLVDDSLYEEDEDFSVYIIPSVDYTVVSSKYNRSLVTIKPDVNDGKYT